MQSEAYGWLWGGWRAAASVAINRTAFLNGEIDLDRLLSTIPDEFYALMRRTISRYGRRFTISLDDDAGDAVHALLEGAQEASAKRSRVSPRRGAATYRTGLSA